MQKIRIDFDNPGLPQHISAVENDSQSRFFQATLYENGKAYIAPEGAAYSIMYRGFGPQNEGWYDTINDGAGKRAACAVSGNVVTCEIARQVLQVPGHVSIVLCVTTGKGYMIKSWPIECDCKNDRYDSTVVIQSFFYITQVSNADWARAIQALEELKNTIDPTLSLSGKAADAAKVGEAINAESERAKGVESQLKEEIAELKYNQDTEYVITTYKEYNQMAIGTNGDTADITELIGDTSWSHLVVLCDAGSIAYVTGEGGEEPRAWALVAKDGSILSAAGTSAKCENVMLDITTDCYVVVNSIANKEHSLTIISPKKVKSAIENRLATDRFVTADDWVVGAIRTNLGVGSVVELTVDETITNYRSQVIDCYAGMRINIKGRGGDYGRLWCFVNREDKIIATSEAYARDAEVIAEQNGKCIVCAEVSSDTVMSVEYTPYSLAPVLAIACDNKEEIENIQASLCDKVPFGIGINCNYSAPEIDALNLPGKGRLAYFYGLYDSLLAEYPEYISKLDCDAAAVAAGIKRPATMNDYPIYLYKFVPAYTHSSNVGETNQRSKIKVFITTGTHPEYMAIWDMYHTMRLICSRWKTDDNLEALRWDCEIYVMPCSGAYVVEQGTRVNYNGVDLNRNAPSTKWKLTENNGLTYSGPSAGSEYETKVFVHFMSQIAPDVYVDHHNTDPIGDPGNAIYGTGRTPADVDILSEHISVMSRRWKKRFADVFPQNDTTIFGYASDDDTDGSREQYGAEHAMRSFTYESQTTLLWSNGELVDGAHANDEVACTCATDGFINFLLRMLKTTN